MGELNEIEKELRRRLQAYIETGKIQWKKSPWDLEKSVFEDNASLIDNIKDLKYKYANKGKLHCLIPELIYEFYKDEIIFSDKEGGFHCSGVNLRDPRKFLLCETPCKGIILIYISEVDVDA